MSEENGGTADLIGQAMEGTVYQHAKDQRMVVFNETEYVPNADLISMKESLTRQRDEALAAQSQSKETLQTLESQVSDFQSKLSLSEGSLDDARKQILATQDNLSKRDAAMKKAMADLESQKIALQERELTIERTRIAREYGIDEEVLKEFKNPKDMEITALKKTKEMNQTPPGKMPPPPVPGGIVGNIPDPLTAAKNIISMSKHVGAIPSKVT